VIIRILIIIAVGLLLLAGVLAFLAWRHVQQLEYEHQPPPLPESFDAFYQEKLAVSRARNARPGNEERLIRKSEGQTEWCLLFIHGYSASRAAGEYVIERLADDLDANAYLLRLPGHGTNPDDHAAATYRDYLDEVETALRMMPRLGKKVAVAGSSMGGLLATWLAARHPERVDALVLFAPFYDYANSAGKLLQVPGLLSLMQTFDGPNREIAFDAFAEDRIQEGYENHWYQTQRYEALRSLEDLRAFCSKSIRYAEVTAPVLLFYYYENEQRQDGAANVAAMLGAFDEFGKNTGPGYLKRKVQVTDGNHVLASAFVHTDKALILEECARFFKALKRGKNNQ